MYVEAVREESPPSRAGLVRDFMRIECRSCKAAYHLYHDGVRLKLLRDYFFQASFEIGREHPDHSPSISLEPHSTAGHRQVS
jgi:hypothetical protein